MPKPVRYEMQWDEETYALAERAARASGLTSIKAYVTQLVKQHAPEVLEAYSSIQLTNAQFDAFARPVTIRLRQQPGFVRQHKHLTKRASC